MEKIYSYSESGQNSSDKFDKAYYLIGRYLPVESVKFGYSSARCRHHKLFLQCDLSEEDLLFFSLKTGVNLKEEKEDSPNYLGGRISLTEILPEKIWLTYKEFPIYVRIQEESLLEL